VCYLNFVIAEYHLPGLLTGIEPDQLRADGWAIGYDERFPKKQRIQQALLFARLSQHENLYAHPLVR
jgi:Cu2+-containing amine oxidase